MKVSPLQMLTAIGVIAGFGPTVTVIVNGMPVHIEDEGVTEYVAVWIAFVGFTRVPLIDAPLPATPPVRPPVTEGALQV